MGLSEVAVESRSWNTVGSIHQGRRSGATKRKAISAVRQLTVGWAAIPFGQHGSGAPGGRSPAVRNLSRLAHRVRPAAGSSRIHAGSGLDRKSTRLNSSHVAI